MDSHGHLTVFIFHQSSRKHSPRPSHDVANVLARDWGQARVINGGIAVIWTSRKTSKALKLQDPLRLMLQFGLKVEVFVQAARSLWMYSRERGIVLTLAALRSKLLGEAWVWTPLRSHSYIMWFDKPVSRPGPESTPPPFSSFPPPHHQPTYLPPFSPSRSRSPPRECSKTKLWQHSPLSSWGNTWTAIKRIPLRLRVPLITTDKNNRREQSSSFKARRKKDTFQGLKMILLWDDTWKKQTYNLKWYGVRVFSQDWLGHVCLRIKANPMSCIPKSKRLCRPKFPFIYSIQETAAQPQAISNTLWNLN